ncbi:MAG: 2-oxoglutarate dehydrogenase complex dihydrolipoyllysine-residue succinyltransferase [Kofleriaceae bacterium]
MADLVVPPVGESITEAVVSRWLKNIGDSVAADEAVAELETDKITVQLNSPAAGALAEQKAAEGATVKVGDVIGTVDTSRVAEAKPDAEAKAEPKPAAEPKTEAEPKTAAKVEAKPAAKAEAKPPAKSDGKSAAAKPAAPVALSKSDAAPPGTPGAPPSKSSQPIGKPATQAEEIATATPRGGNGQPLDKDALLKLTPSQRASAREAGSLPRAQASAAAPSRPSDDARLAQVDPRDEVVAMSPLRKRVAERLVQAQHESASLTTFNEVDMTAIMELRAKYKETFEKAHGVKLGFMSFFVKACVAAAKLYPGVNAEVLGGSIVYKKHYDFGIAVSAPKGLVVPVLRDCDSLSFAGVEQGIGQLADKARTGKLGLPDLSGGTFTITNGGIYGSMMSTPLLNYPQTGILGMHNIVKRAVVIGDEVVVRPMMYVALSYDHRVVDGREAVSFLVAVKDRLESPERLLVEV